MFLKWDITHNINAIDHPRQNVKALLEKFSTAQSVLFPIYSGEGLNRQILKRQNNVDLLLAG